MTDILTMHASATPAKVAVIEDPGTADAGVAVRTFAELERDANAVAHVLQGLGTRVGDRVLWCGQNSTEIVTIVNATRKAGAVSVPLNYRLSAEEAAYVIDNCDAKIVLFDVDQAGQLGPAVELCSGVEHWLAYRCDAAAVPSWAAHLETAGAATPTTPVEPVGDGGTAGGAMIYTSGTTGKPKGALRRGTTAGASATGLVAKIGFVPDDVYVTTGPLYHSAPLGFMSIVQALGGTVVVQRHFDPEGWLRLVDRHRITTTFSAPTPLRRVVDLPEDVRRRYDTSSLERFIANAAPWPFELKRKYVDALGNTSLFEVYGSTELGVNTLLLPEDQMRKPGSCGRPAPGVEIVLFDDDGEQVTTPMEPGELYVRSDATFDTYWKAEEKYDASLRDGYLTVGDIAYFDEEGFFYICDRKSDMIISGGVNIYPAEIEAVLVAHSAIADAAVFGIPSQEWGESVHAVLTLYPGHEATDEQVQAFAREHLAPYKVPRSFQRMDEIPRSASGKVQKKELRAPWWDGQQRS